MAALRYRLWNSDDVAGYVVIDPSFVATVVETERRRAYGGNNRVAIVRLSDGKEYVVEDDGRRVQSEIWAAKTSVS